MTKRNTKKKSKSPHKVEPKSDKDLHHLVILILRLFLLLIFIEFGDFDLSIFSAEVVVQTPRYSN